MIFGNEFIKKTHPTTVCGKLWQKQPFPKNLTDTTYTKLSKWTKSNSVFKNIAIQWFWKRIYIVQTSMVLSCHQSSQFTNFQKWNLLHSTTQLKFKILKFSSFDEYIVFALLRGIRRFIWSILTVLRITIYMFFFKWIY